MVYGQYGSNIYVYTGYDMSSYTNLNMIFFAPDGTNFSRNAALGITTYSSSTGVVWAANMWCYYRVAQSDFSQYGIWQARVEYTDPSQFLLSAISYFQVTT